MTETLNGFIERVTYHNPENGFAVLRVKVKGREDLVTVIGSTTSVTAGEHVEASGRWVIDRQHGQQFKADELKTTHPASAEGIEKYLASGAIRSIGPKIAAKIVAVHHERTLEIFEKAPDFLLHIKGIGQERLKRIRQSWEEQKEVRKIMLFLTEHGITSGRAVRIYRTYGHESIAKIKENPYQLADDIRGIGFKTADELAAKLGIDRNSPYRARAAVLYTLQELAGEGHCGFPESGVVEHTTKLVEIDQQIVEEAVQTAVQDRSVIREDVDGEPWLYLASLHRAEVGLAKSVHRIASAPPHPLPRIDVDKAIAWVEKRLGIQLAAGQQEAIRQACQHKMLVITGGPGVGKTTLVRSILEIFAAKEMKCVLTAPTGRAAKRLAETTERTAKTIHRLLEFDPATGEFKKNQQNPLSGDLFVLDETSMVDVVLGHQFLRAVPARSLRHPGGRRGSTSLGRPRLGPGRPDRFQRGPGRTAHGDLPASQPEPDRHRRLCHQPWADAEVIRTGSTDRLLLRRSRRAGGDPGPAGAAGQGANSRSIRLRSEDRHPSADAHESFACWGPGI